MDIKFKIYVVIIGLIMSVEGGVLKAEEIESDTLAADTIKHLIYMPSKNHGSMADIVAPSQIIGKRDLVYDNYSDFSDILYLKTSGFPLSLGSFGQNNTASFYGGGYRDNAFLFNGRTISEHDFGGFAATQFPVEFFEKAEIFKGSDAVAIADNSSGTAVNFQEIYYNTAKPYTRLWYSQAGFEFLSADAVFSQNFAPNWNVTAGLSTMVTLGEYENEQLRSWNGRIKFRYTPDSLNTFSFTENYSNIKIGLNGGINPGESELLYNSFYAEPYYSDLTERTFRHDMTLTHTSISVDSTRTLKSNLYFTNIMRKKTAGDFYFSPDSSKKIEYYTNSVGANTAFEKKIGAIDFTAGGDISYLDIPDSAHNDEYAGANFAAYSRIAFNMTEKWSVSGAGRFSGLYGNTGANFGGRIKYSGSKNEFFIDGSISNRFPTPAEGLALDMEKHLLALAGYTHTRENFQWQSELYLRNVTAPIFATPEYNEDGEIIYLNCRNSEFDKSVAGINLRAEFNIKKKFFFDIKTNLTLTDYSDTLTSLLPGIYADARLYYLIKKVKSDLRLGIESQFMTMFDGEVYSPLQRLTFYIPNENRRYGAEVSVFAAARFRGTYVKIAIDNVLDYGYYYVPYYPQLGRNIRVSISAPFLK
jgi:hypothetical protein